jgi:hypothetical protein
MSLRRAELILSPRYVHSPGTAGNTREDPRKDRGSWSAVLACSRLFPALGTAKGPHERRCGPFAVRSEPLTRTQAHGHMFAFSQSAATVKSTPAASSTIVSRRTLGAHLQRDRGGPAPPSAIRFGRPSEDEQRERPGALHAQIAAIQPMRLGGRRLPVQRDGDGHHGHRVTRPCSDHDENTPRDHPPRASATGETSFAPFRAEQRSARWSLKSWADSCASSDVRASVQSSTRRTAYPDHAIFDVQLVTCRSKTS